MIIVADHDRVFSSDINLNGTEVLYLRSLNEALNWMNKISIGETKIPHISQVWVNAESIPVESVSSTTPDESQSKEKIFTDFEPLVLFLCELFENEKNLMLSPDSFVLYGDEKPVSRIKRILVNKFPVNILDSVDKCLTSATSNRDN